MGSYLHVFLEENNEIEEVTEVSKPKFKVLQAFAHYSGDGQDYIKSKFKRVHECNCYKKGLNRAFHPAS